MLVFLKLGVHGHYAVIRPVGISGNLLQIIDLTRGPEVVDKKALFSSPEWTGLALVPTEGIGLSRFAIALSVTAAALVLLPLLYRGLCRTDRGLRSRLPQRPKSARFLRGS
jgi:hypothetical protein